MTRRRHGVGALLAAGLAAALLSGCGGGTLKPADVTAPGFGDDAHGTVVVWCRADTEKVEEEIAARFNATHKGLHVDVVPIVDTEYETKLATAIRGGYVPDVVDSDDINAQLFIYHDAFDNLTPLIDKLPYRNELAKAMLDLSVHDGRYYGVPFSADISLLYYNKSLFKRAGLNPDDPPATMTQVVADARRITALGHGITGYSFGGDQAGILGFTEQPPVWAEKEYLFNGVTGHQTADIAHNVALAQTLQDLRAIWRAHLAPVSDRTQTGATWGKDFAAGTVGMWPGNWGTLVADDIKFPLGVGEIPGPTHGASAFAGGDNVGIPAGAKNPSGAWEYIKFALAPAQQELLPSLGYTPIRTNLIDSAAVRRYAGTTVGEKALMGSAYAPNTIAYETVINEESGPFEGMFLAGIYGHEPIAKLLSQYQSQFDSAVAEAQN